MEQSETVAAVDPLAELSADRLAASDSRVVAAAIVDLGRRVIPGHTVEIVRPGARGSMVVMASSHPGELPPDPLATDDVRALVFPLTVAERNYGHLRFRVRNDGEPEAWCRRAAETLAAHAALALDRAALLEQIANLRTAVDSNREIGAAVGVLMGRRMITYRAAFELLRTASQDANRKLREVAAEVLYVGDLPAHLVRRASTKDTNGRRDPAPSAGRDGRVGPAAERVDDVEAGRRDPVAQVAAGHAPSAPVGGERVARVEHRDAHPVDLLE